MLLSNKITITVTEVVLIQVPFLLLILNKNDNDEHVESHDIFIPFKDRIYSKQGNHISLLFVTWTLVLFLHAGAQPEFFQGRGGFVELGHFDKYFVNNTRKKGPARKNFGVFFSKIL